MEFEIGDLVTEIFSGKDYKIVADKNTPYKGPMGDIYPNERRDFILKRAELEEGENVLLVHCVREHIQPLKKDI